MDCQSLEFLCQRRFDDRLPLASLAELPEFSSHVSLCESCRETYARLAQLDASLGAWKEKAHESPELTDRIVRAALNDRRPLTFVTRHRQALLATAALLVVGVGLGIGASWNLNRPQTPEIGATAEVPPLRDALAEATTATLDLARKTSGPATKIGGRMFARARLPSSPQLSLNVPIRPASEVISVIGDDVNRGVKPLSGTARNAFGFLLAPWSHDKPKDVSPDGQGA